MHPLTRAALARTAMTVDEVRDLYAASVQPTVRNLCESHERLRAELAGAEVLLADLERFRAALEEIAAAMPGGDLTDNNYTRQHIARRALGRA